MNINWISGNLFENVVSVGHMFISADSFHYQMELFLERMVKVYDFAEFKLAVERGSSRAEIGNMEHRMHISIFSDFLQTNQFT